MNLRPILLLALVGSAERALAADTKAVPAPAGPAAVVATPARAPAAPAVAPRNDSSVAPSATYETFRLITNRNIFNPNRTGRRDRSLDEAPPRVDVMALVGTMDSDRGLRAFFDGSDAAFRKALHVGDSIDKFKVARIAPNVVDLERDGKSFSVTVGQQFRRPEGGDWNLVAVDIARQEAQARAVEGAKVDPSAPVAIPANVDEVTKRMMEKRNQTLKQ